MTYFLIEIELYILYFMILIILKNFEIFIMNLIYKSSINHIKHYFLRL